ncbi:hypothetical protein LIER_42080 [Lithospermum erythrorhizon]|uniref:CCHC-type domain-containing protein n=1 Tax=Lithospermum erythrorhizon TaxID=34254 RepID=A0AAV3RL39_LITER
MMFYLTTLNLQRFSIEEPPTGFFEIFQGKKKSDFAPKGNTFEKSGSTSHGNSVKAFDGVCYNCNKRGHMSFECRQPKKCNNENNMANVVTKE